MELKNFNRRDLLKIIGVTAGSSAMYHAMTALSHANESTFTTAPVLGKAKKGTKVLILGGGLAGLVSAYELEKAGYEVQILEFSKRLGGRAWAIHGGDKFSEIDNKDQVCHFDSHLYLNPGPWRIPYHHRGYLHYARQLGVKLEPFNSLNGNSLLHSTSAFGGKPQYFRHVFADLNGHINELLAKAVNKNELDEDVTTETKEILLEALRSWGALDKNYQYTGASGSAMRGYEKDAGARSDNVPSQPIALNDLLSSKLWQYLNEPLSYEFGGTIFEPVGGMDALPKAFAKTLKSKVIFNAKVTRIIQKNDGVSVTYQDVSHDNSEKTSSAAFCICTIPFSMLKSIENNFSDNVNEAIKALPYGTSFKAGVQFKRRFWEQDEDIYGGVTFTDLPIEQISYPNTDYLSKGKGVVLGAYLFANEGAKKFSKMTIKERTEVVVQSMQIIHPQTEKEFDSAISFSWDKNPYSLGCFGTWTDDLRKQYFNTVAKMESRVAFAGEHISYIPAWQEGAILSALEAIKHVHQHASQQA